MCGIAGLISFKNSSRLSPNEIGKTLKMMSTRGPDFQKHVEILHVDRVFYADQYRWMDFGRGKLAELTFYAKQSQNSSLIMQSISHVFPTLLCLLKQEDIDAIAITPWSIKRVNQLLGFLRKQLENQPQPGVDLHV